MEHEGRSVALLPGVPREMRGIFEDVLGDVIRDRFEDRLVPLVHRTLHTTGIPESVLGERVDEVRAGLPEEVDLAFLPGLRGVSIRISIRSRADAAEKLLDEAQAILDPIVAPYRIGMEKSDLVEAVAEVLASESNTLAVAESCTGGSCRRGSQISRFLDLLPGGSDRICRSGQTRIARRRGGCARRERSGFEAVAAGMACGVADLLNADIGVGITGIAGPGEAPLRSRSARCGALSPRREVCARHTGSSAGIVRRSENGPSQMALLLLYQMLADRP